MKKNLLIVGGTSGFMIASIKSFLEKKYKIFATYSAEKSLLNIPKNLKKSKNIKFVKLDLLEEDEKILKVLKKNKVKADIIINAVGGTPSSLIAILEALKRSGSLKAELIVI